VLEHQGDDLDAPAAVLPVQGSKKAASSWQLGHQLPASATIITLPRNCGSVGADGVAGKIGEGEIETLGAGAHGRELVCVGQAAFGVALPPQCS